VIPLFVKFSVDERKSWLGQTVIRKIILPQDYMNTMYKMDTMSAPEATRSCLIIDKKIEIIDFMDKEKLKKDDLQQYARC
jgi:hypothetical protein